MWTCKRKVFHEVREKIDLPTKHLFGDYWLFRQYTKDQRRFSWWLICKLVDK